MLRLDAKRIRAARHRRMSPPCGRAPFSAMRSCGSCTPVDSFPTPSTPLDGPTEHRFLRPSRAARHARAASPPLRSDEEPDPAPPRWPCACAPCFPRSHEVTPSPCRRARGTSSSRRTRRPHVRGDLAYELRPSEVERLAPLHTEDPDPEGSAG